MLVHVGSLRDIFCSLLWVCCSSFTDCFSVTESLPCFNGQRFAFNVEGYHLVRYDWKQFSLQIRLFEVKGQKIA